MTPSASWQARNFLNRDKPFTPQEVAKLFNVDPKTVTRWAAAGKLKSFRTPGGHRRFHADDVLAYFQKRTTGKDYFAEDEL